MRTRAIMDEASLKPALLQTGIGATPSQFVVCLNYLNLGSIATPAAQLAFTFQHSLASSSAARFRDHEATSIALDDLVMIDDEARRGPPTRAGSRRRGQRSVRKPGHRPLVADAFSASARMSLRFE